MEILYYIPVGLILTYLVVTCLVFKTIPISISNTYYMWSEKGVRMLFTFVMWAVGVPILIYWIQISPQVYQFLPFLSISGMLFVGAACAFKETLTKEVHFTSAGVWASTALLYFILRGSYESIVVGATIGILGLILNKFTNFTFWAEVACVVMMIFGIGILGGIL